MTQSIIEAILTPRYVVNKRIVDGTGKIIGLNCKGPDGKDHSHDVRQIASSICGGLAEYVVVGVKVAKAMVSVRLVTEMDGDESDNLSSLPKEEYNF